MSLFNFSSSVCEANLSNAIYDVLKHLYLSARKVDSEMYKVNALVSTRYSLNRYLKSPPVQKTFDIIKDNEFNEANMCFKTAITELRANGKGTTEHHPIVSEEDRKKYQRELRSYYSVLFP
jgi:ribosomal protein S15P/S13E